MSLIVTPTMPQGAQPITTAFFRRRVTLRRFFAFVLIACCSSALFVSVFYHLSWRHIQPAAFRGEGEERGPTEDSTRNGEERMHTFKEPKIDSTSPYPIGATKPAGSNYTRALVLPRLKREDTSWVQRELGDMIDVGLLTPAVYTVDDRKAKLHPPKNKGHEVMVYLTYIIDFYDQLADVNIFMHAHRYAWHNNELLDTDAAQMVRHLSPERVTREGYMNLRCHWVPGCPAWLHPGSTKNNIDKPEEILLAECWSQLFPMDPVPSVVAQACCAQFAVSRERIRATPKMRYIVMRDWLIRTDLTDYLSGRIFEYIWAYIFTAAPVHCPSMSACYCDGYGLCFGGPKEFDYYFELKYQKTKLDEEMKAWGSKGKDVEELEGKVKMLELKMAKLRDEALSRGESPKQRAIESGREWNDGDGF